MEKTRIPNIQESCFKEIKEAELMPSKKFIESLHGSDYFANWKTITLHPFFQSYSFDQLDV